MIVQATTGQVFAADLVAKKIMVFYTGVTNAEAGEQAPYRWLFGPDASASAVNGVQFAARQLKGETAKWSGDFTDEKRVFGAIHPERGIDWEFFTKHRQARGVQARTRHRPRVQRPARQRHRHARSSSRRRRTSSPSSRTRA